METKVLIRRISNDEYTFSDSTAEGVRCVCTALTFDNPSPFAFESQIRKFDRQRLTFRVGMLSNVLAYCGDEGVTCTVDDYVFPEPKLPIDDRMCSRDRLYQRRAVEEFFRRRQGILKVPTRGGKTFIAAEILRQFLAMEVDGDALFVVDSITLFTQAVDDFRGYFERYGGIELGEIRAGVVRYGRVTVCMIQTLQSVLKRQDRSGRDAVKFLRQLKMLVVDEVHDNFSASRMRVYKRCRNLQYKLCLSATPFKAGEQNFVQNLRLQEWSGGVIYEITEDVLRKAGVLTDYTVVLLYVHHTEQCDSYDDCVHKLLYENLERNEKLYCVMSVLGRLRVKTLCLFQNIQHGRYVQQQTGNPFISGTDSGEERERVKSEFLNMDGGFLLASNIFKKGVTLPQAQCLVNVDGGLEDANTVQRKGRVLGAVGGKTRSMVVDFIDDDGSYLSKHSLARMEQYIRDVGERSVKVIDTSARDWVSVFSSRVEKWFGDE